MPKATIYYHDIGDYLNREEKLEILRKMSSIENPAMQWEILHPNEHHDWINQRNEGFSEFIPLAPEKKFDGKTRSVFTTYAVGVNTARDAWTYNFSRKSVYNNMSRMIDFYNNQCKGYQEKIKTESELAVEDFIDTNETKISWTVNLKRDISKGIQHALALNVEREGLYRPYTKEWLYFDVPFIERPGLNAALFPTGQAGNIVICISPSANDALSVLISDKIVNLHFNGDTQCFPLYWYEEIPKQAPTLFDSVAEPQNDYYARRDGISNFIWEQAKQRYGSKTTKEDVFYYVYAFLHNPDYREQFASDLKKQLPRIPLVDDSVDFWKYVKAGRELADLHLHYEDYADEAPVTVEFGTANYEVTKMRFPSKDDKSRIIYNPFITLTGIPAEAYEYVVNGKSAIEWVMERYQKTINKESGIVNDPNDWAREHDQPRYILDLLLSVIVVSVRTVEIVKGLPKVELKNNNV